MSRIMTVTGWVNSDLVSNTYVHEHLYTTATPSVLADNPLMALTDLDKIAIDLELFKKAGGNCIAEMTTVDYGRDVTKLKELAQRSGVYVVAVGGFNKDTYNRSFLEGKDIDDVAKALISEVTQGVDQTGIKPGLLKIGTSLNVILPSEEIGLRAVARASKKTGIHITTHTQAGTMAKEQLAMFIEEGVDPGCVILGHLDQLDDFETHLELVKQGAFLGYDSIPKAKYNTKDRAIEFIIRLAKLGLHTQVLISGDFARQDYFTGYGGTLGLDHLLQNFKPELYQRLSESGLDADKIVDDLFIHNPRRALSFKETVKP